MRTVDEDWNMLDCLAPIILGNVEGCLVDIGIGPSTRVLFKHSQDLKREHYSCDKKDTRCEWAKDLGIPNVYCGKSLEFIKQFPDIPVALAFIDGSHEYEIVIQETNFFLKKLVLGGVIFLHDTYPPFDRLKNCGNVWRVRMDMEREVNVQTFTWPYTATDRGLTMLMKKLPGAYYMR